jgi:AcrR family transcriptional regulator
MKQKLDKYSGVNMDRRQIKTRNAIYNAFNDLLIRINYNDITIQNIIDEANIGRSTFYLHFDTKEELLESMCNDFFEHITEAPTQKEKTHDFSHAKLNISNMVSHILYHLKDSSSSVYGLLKSDMSYYFYNKLEEIFTSWCQENLHFNSNTPEDLSLLFISGNLINLCKWSVKTNFKATSEASSEYFIESIKNLLETI